jgi:chromosome partitioning protein
MGDHHAGDKENSQDPTAISRGGNAERREAEAVKKCTPWGTHSARVISFVSRKGGVGKTTSCVNLGAALALSGHAVLIVGVDPQCGVSRSLGYGRQDLDGGLADIFTSSVPMTHLVYTTALQNLFFVTPSIWTLKAEETFTQFMEMQVETFVQEIERARNLYDTILIDCPPGLHASTRAALLASDSYLVPVQAEELCRDSLGRLLDFIMSFGEEAYAESNMTSDDDHSAPLLLEGLFLTMVSNRTRMSRHVLAKVQEDYGDRLLPIAIPRSTRLTEMALRGKPAVIYDRRSASSRAYFDLMDEIMTRHNGQTRAGDEADAVKLAPRSSEAFPLPADKVEPPVPEDNLPPNSMAHLLADLGNVLPIQGDSYPFSSEAYSPELVSLDDLLAEEERDDLDENWDTSWEGDGGAHKRHH